MPKARLEFNLPEEQDDFYVALKGVSYSCCIHDIFEELRKRIRYPSEKETPEIQDYLDELRATLFKIVDEWGVKL